MVWKLNWWMKRVTGISMTGGAEELEWREEKEAAGLGRRKLKKNIWLNSCSWGFFGFVLEIVPYKLLKVKVLVTQSCPTLYDLNRLSPPDSSVHGVSQARILEWVAIPFSRGLPNLGIKPGLLYCRQILYHLLLLYYSFLHFP